MAGQCTSCAFKGFFYSDHGTFPVCRRYPPQIMGESITGVSRFPRVSADDWCGEYQPEE